MLITPSPALYFPFTSPTCLGSCSTGGCGERRLISASGDVGASILRCMLETKTISDSCHPLTLQPLLRKSFAPDRGRFTSSLAGIQTIGGDRSPNRRLANLAGLQSVSGNIGYGQQLTGNIYHHSAGFQMVFFPAGSFVHILGKCPQGNGYQKNKAGNKTMCFWDTHSKTIFIGWQNGCVTTSFERYRILPDILPSWKGIYPLNTLSFKDYLDFPTSSLISIQCPSGSIM